jgi:hexosaminidase
MGSWQIVPLPQQVKEMSSAPFRITAKTTIYYAAGDEKQKKDAEFLASHIKEVTGIEVKTTDKQAKGQIRLALNAGDTKSEAYSLVVNKNGITISATSHVGIFYGIQSVMKALPITKNVKSVSLPAAEVTDAPRFAYRAFMIDVGRHYFSVPYLKKLIDVFAMHNINYFHCILPRTRAGVLKSRSIRCLPRLVPSARKLSCQPTRMSLTAFLYRAIIPRMRLAKS